VPELWLVLDSRSQQDVARQQRIRPRGRQSHLCGRFLRRHADKRPKPERIAAQEAGGRQQGGWVLARDLRAGNEVLLRHGEVVALELAGARGGATAARNAERHLDGVGAGAAV
jgi:hypothetical protein